MSFKVFDTEFCRIYYHGDDSGDDSGDDGSKEDEGQ
jgi:hypothetical protein